MKLERRNGLVYGILALVWLLVVAWQVEEHVRVKEAAKRDLRNRSEEIANTLSAVIRAFSFRGGILQERLEPVLNELVNERTNELVGASGLISVALLNTAGTPVVSVGRPINFQQKDILQDGVHWGPKTVVFVNPVEGALRAEGNTNATVLLPSFREFTNRFRERDRDFPRRPPDRTNANSRFLPNGPDRSPPEGPPRPERGPGPPGPPPDRRPGEREPFRREGPMRPHRPPWLRWMSEKDFEALVQKRELHGLVLAMSTENYRAICRDDLWLRYIIGFFAGISALGVGVAWGIMAKSSELQIRLVRASEMNTHLKEMNLAAAGLAHETRNPLNIIRGLAQLISKQPDAPPEIRGKSREIVDEADKVTVQLNEFINYSRPRELRRTTLALNAVVTEVVRALNYDIEEKKIQVQVRGEALSIEADEQMFRQVLFNLVLNAIQAVDAGGEIQLVARRDSAAEGSLDVRDNGPGVPPARRGEIFKPYFTTHQKGTGLGLAIVQQIVLAHGWEIECLSNEPKGALFRVTHLKLNAKH